MKIKPEDIRTELEDDQDGVRTEVTGLFGKYTVQVIFQQRDMMFEYSDKALWNTILNNIEEDGTEDMREREMQLEREDQEY